jgi:hypothetical protein
MLAWSWESVRRDWCGIFAVIGVVCGFCVEHKLRPVIWTEQGKRFRVW